MENSYNDGRLIIPYDKDRKAITFYDTFFDMDGDTVKYDDIAVVQTSALNSSSMIYFYFSNSFKYNFTFTTYDGAIHELKRKGYSAYGIGTYKRIKNEYGAVSEPMYNIVIRRVASRLVAEITDGAEACICGLVITKDRMTFTKRKNNVEINRDNLDRIENVNGYGASYVQIYVKGEKRPVFRASLSEPNARLILPVADCFFGTSAP